MKIKFVPYSKIKDIAFINPVDNVAGIGVFDGVHIGHRKLIQKIVDIAKKKNVESTIITFYPPTRFLFGKNKHLLTTNLEKIGLFEKIGIDRVIIFEFNREFSMLSPEEFLEIIKLLKVKVLCVGEDFRFGYKQRGDLKFMKEKLKDLEIQVEGVDISTIGSRKISSTYIKELLLKGEIKKANMYLGYEFFMMGFPYQIRNGWKIITHIDKIKPLDGIYKVRVLDKKNTLIKIYKKNIYMFLKERGFSSVKPIKISFIEKEMVSKNRIEEFTYDYIYAKL